MDKKYDIAVILDTCVDFLIQCGRVEPEFDQKEKLIQDYRIELGGSCCIFACGTAKLGLKTLGIGVVGNDQFGHIVKDKLNEAGVITHQVRVDNSWKTGMGLALCLDDGDRAILTYNGTINAITPSDVKEEYITNTRHIHIGSYYLMKQLQDAYIELLIKAKASGATISMDTNWDPDEQWDSGIWEVLPYVDIFLPNENEIMAITKATSVEQAVKRISEVVPILVLKKGKEGASVYFENEVLTSEALSVQVVDTVGAGDSFDAGFVYAYLSGHSLTECLKIGTICGSCNVTCAGGIEGQPTIYKLKEMLRGDQNGGT